MIKAVFYFDDNNVTIHSENTKNVEKAFLPGYYEVIQGDNLIIRRIEFSELHKPFPNQNLATVMLAIKQFLGAESKEACNEMGYIYKLNCLIHGKPGVGKTALINYLSSRLIENNNAIVFRIDNPSQMSVAWALAEKVREIQDNIIVFIVDEFDLYAGKNNESFIKNCLDGNRSIDNSIVFAATNYIDRIPDTLTERPSRFRVVEKVGGLTDKSIIKSIIKSVHDKASKPFFTEDEIDQIVSEMKETTIDKIKTLIQDKVMKLTLILPEKDSVGFKTASKEKEENEKIKSLHDELTAFWDDSVNKPKVSGLFGRQKNNKETSVDSNILGNNI